jgi:hypothetical protein
VDRELAALFMIFDESGLGEAEREAAEYGGLPMGAPPPKTWTQVQELTELGARRSINGSLFGNLPGLEMNEGERVRWYLFALGSEQDFHTAHWHGLRVVEEGRRRTDVVELLPASMKVADMLADNPGQWLFHCHVAEHMMGGMFARMTVHPKTAAGVSRARTDAFFGLPRAEQSLQIRRAEATLDFSANTAQPCELKLTGAVTVFQAFSVFTQPVQLQIGDASVSFKPDRKGMAASGQNSWAVKNAGQFGVVYGGTMEFETTLSGAEWLRALTKAGLTPTSGSELSVPMTLQVGNAKHVGTARMQWRAK